MRSACTIFASAKLRNILEKFNLKKALGYVVKIGLPIAIGVCLFYWLYNNVDVAEMREILRYDVDYRWIFLMLAISVFSHVFRGLRWRLQLRSIGVDVPVAPVVVSIFGTYAVNLLFPRLGEVWRCGYISRRQNAPFTKVVGSMVADRLTDTVTVLLLTVVAVLLAGPAFDKFFTTFPQVKDGLWHLLTSLWLWGGLAVAAVAVAALFRFGSSNALVCRAREMVANVWQGFAAIAKMDGKWQFLLYTALIWGCYFVQLYVCFFAFDFTSGLGIVCALVCFVLSSISMGIPTNGGLGAWHIAVIFGLSLYGVGTFSFDNPDARASAFAMLVWGAQTLVLILLGIYTYIYVLLDGLKRKRAKGRS